MKIPFVDLKAQYQSIKAEIDEAIQNVIDETAFIKGKYVQQFEDEYAQSYSVKHCIGIANGTDAIWSIIGYRTPCKNWKWSKDSFTGLYPRILRFRRGMLEGPNVVLTNAKYPNSSHAKTELAGVNVMKNATIGANPTVLPGVIIGQNVLVGAGSVLNKGLNGGRGRCRRKSGQANPSV